MIQTLSDILDDAARGAEPIYRAYHWEWPFGASPRVPDAIDIRHKLAELANDLGGTTGERTYKELTITRFAPPEEEVATWKVTIALAKGDTELSDV